MIDRPRRRSAYVVAPFLGAAVACVAGCHRVPPAELPPAPVLPAIAQIEPPAPRRVTVSEPGVLDTAKEQHVDVDTHGAQVDVRTLLDFIARAGGFTLVYSPNVNRRIGLTMNNVPVSVALETVLSLAGLTLESATPGMKVPGRPTVVFYQLPMNVDSLPVDAIMRRFDVSRAVAEMIVLSRAEKP